MDIGLFILFLLFEERVQILANCVFEGIGPFYLGYLVCGHRALYERKGKC